MFAVSEIFIQEKFKRYICDKTLKYLLLSGVCNFRRKYCYSYKKSRLFRHAYYQWTSDSIKNCFIFHVQCAKNIDVTELSDSVSMGS